jgi:hypothetical protein
VASLILFTHVLDEWIEGSILLVVFALFSMDCCGGCLMLFTVVFELEVLKVLHVCPFIRIALVITEFGNSLDRG